MYTPVIKGEVRKLLDWSDYADGMTSTEGWAITWQGVSQILFYSDILMT